MEEIALAAGVSVGTLYNHFADREALLAALLDTRRAELLARLDEALAGTEREPFQVQLTRFMGAMVEHLSHHRTLFSMLVEEELRSGRGRLRGKPVLRDLTARCNQLVERGLAQGALRRGDEKLYPALLMGYIRGFFAQAAHDDTLRMTPELVQALVRTFLEGAGARA
jgi:AcrR family transcriptional regulator